MSKSSVSISQNLQSNKVARPQDPALLKVLIVDDDDQFRALLARQLKEQGFRNIAQASDGETALRQAIAMQPDIVILDTVLPPTDGFTVCKQIAHTPGLESTKIIMVTISYRNIDPEKFRRVGANIYTLKSKNFDCIMQAIHIPLE